MAPSVKPKCLRFYHETKEKNVPDIRTHGLRANQYWPRWYTITDWIGGAYEYASGDPDRVVIELCIPADKFKEYVWSVPGYSEHYGNQYALRKVLPPEFIVSWTRAGDLDPSTFPNRPEERHVKNPAASEEWIYHETKKEHVDDIREEGLIPMSYGQWFVDDYGEVLAPDDFSEEELEDAPEEDLVQRTYVTTSEPKTLLYGDRLLRFPKNVVGRMKKDVDYYITKVVPPEVIEIKTNDEWHPLMVGSNPVKASTLEHPVPGQRNPTFRSSKYKEAAKKAKRLSHKAHLSNRPEDHLAALDAQIAAKGLAHDLFDQRKHDLAMHEHAFMCEKMAKSNPSKKSELQMILERAKEWDKKREQEHSSETRYVAVRHSSGDGFVVRDGRVQPDGTVRLPAPYSDAEQLKVFTSKKRAENYVDKLNAQSNPSGVVSKDAAQALRVVDKLADPTTGLAEIPAVVRALKTLPIDRAHEALFELSRANIVELREWSSPDLVSQADKDRMIRVKGGKLLGYVSKKAPPIPQNPVMGHGKIYSAKLGTWKGWNERPVVKYDGGDLIVVKQGRYLFLAHRLGIQLGIPSTNRTQAASKAKFYTKDLKGRELLARTLIAWGTGKTDDPSLKDVAEDTSYNHWAWGQRIERGRR